jgi:tripartite-type tricarboxylate transporter receptor subunit TctC
MLTGKFLTRKTSTIAVSCLLGAALSLGAHADDWPKQKPITIIVPFVPGGSSDITARSVTQGLGERLGQTIVADNKPGANSAIGAQALARSTPDGYTMMVGSIGTFAINEALFKNLSYNPSKDFRYLTQAVRNPNVLVAAPNFPVKSVAELLEYAKKNPESVSYANSGTGSSDQLTAILFRQKTNTTGVDVPYRGGGAAIVDLMGGQVNVSFQNLGAVLTHIKAGKLKALAVSGAERAPDLPDVPSLKELGYDNIVVYSWQGFAVPKDTPDAVVNKLSEALRKTLTQADVTKTLNGLGFEVVANTPDEFAAFQRQEVARWKEVIQSANIQID